MNNHTPASTSTTHAPFAEQSALAAPHVRTIGVTSGKGGVGKTNFVVNVALELAALGRSVTLLDADMALANANVLFGINPAYHIGHVLSGQRTLEEVVVEVSPNVRLIPGSTRRGVGPLAAGLDSVGASAPNEPTSEQRKTAAEATELFCRDFTRARLCNRLPS